jgi:predicted RNase H-like HicB family nuclease
MSQKISVVIEKDAEGYYAYCPELSGCQSQGGTFEEVMANIREAAELYLETLSAEEKKDLLRLEIITTSLEVLQAVRSSNSELLEWLSEEEWMREGTHSEQGRYTVEDWLRIYAAHAHDHAAQMLQVQEA